jgi:predicted ArsR family transcriptional regulator
MSNESLENSKRSAAERFMLALKTRGPQTSAELGCVTGVCGEAARQQLNRLASEGLVTSARQPRGVGRPVTMWSLTPAGNSRFPDAHAALAAQLITSIRKELGEPALQRLIDVRAAETKAEYEKTLAGAADLGDKVARLAAVRTREGYMAESIPDPDPESNPGGYLLVEHHCPICVAAEVCQGFCRAELQVFRDVLGPGVSVERTDHIVRGDRRCAYRVTPTGVT